MVEHAFCWTISISKWTWVLHIAVDDAPYIQNNVPPASICVIAIKVLIIGG